MSEAPRQSRKKVLVNTAIRLFYDHGFQATGIDRILSESGVAKMTLYNHFKSKDDLIVEALNSASRRVLDRMHEQVLNAVGAEERLLSFFDHHDKWFNGDGYKGCLFDRASAEFPDTDHPVHIAAADHKRRVFDLLQALATKTGTSNPPQLAEQILLLLEGAISLSFVTGAKIAARRARRAAELILAAS